MNIVLVCIGNFQEYILINLQQLLRLSHNNIYVITNNYLFQKFDSFQGKITLVAIEDLPDSFNYSSRSVLNLTFRNGFWLYTSLRFFYLYEFMKKYNICDVIHLENDVMIYYNSEVLSDKLYRNKIYLPFDTFKRNIASIMYIPNHIIFEKVLLLYDINKNDMENFSSISNQTGLIDNFPIFIEDTKESLEYQFITKNFNRFNFIFDAAAIGQYLGGVDPRNIEGDSRGFINETCIIKYNKYNIFWKTEDGIRRPFIEIDNDTYPIFNLHIHSKNLKEFS
jgi:hypothetical protein